MSYKKNVTAYVFMQVNSATDGSAITTGTLTVDVAIDAGVASASTNAAAHVSKGMWRVLLTAAELNGDQIGVVWEHTSGINASFTIHTEAVNPDVNVAAMAAGVITATVIATDAIGAAEFAQAAADKIWSTVARTITGGTIDTNNDKTGYSLATAQSFNNTGQTANLPGDVQSWDGAALAGVNMIELDGPDSRWTAQALEQGPAGGGGLTEQQVRDAMKLTPTVGVPAAGSVDLHLDDIQAQTDRVVFTVAGQVDANALTVSDKVGYALTTVQSFNNTGQVANLPANVQAMVAGVITAAAIATDAIGAAEFSQAAADKIWATVARTITGGTIDTNNDKTGYFISGTKTTLDALNDITVAAVEAAIFAHVCETSGGETFEQIMRFLQSAVYGRTTLSGTEYRTPNNIAKRLEIAYDASQNRTLVTKFP